MEAPMQVRFKKPTKSKLERGSRKTGIDQVEFVRLAVDEMFKRYTSEDALMKAYFEWRKQALEGA